MPGSWTQDSLANLARERGIDAATSTLYEHLRDQTLHGDFIRAIVSSEAPSIDASPRVVVVPGAFHAEYRHTGADGARMMKLAQSLGWQAERVPLADLAPMQQNAVAIAEFLERRRGQPVILVSLSKGS